MADYNLGKISYRYHICDIILVESYLYYDVGVAYSTGKGVVQNNQKAIYHYKRSADGGEWSIDRMILTSLQTMGLINCDKPHKCNTPKFIAYI